MNSSEKREDKTKAKVILFLLALFCVLAIGIYPCFYDDEKLSKPFFMRRDELPNMGDDQNLRFRDRPDLPFSGQIQPNLGNAKVLEGFKKMLELKITNKEDAESFLKLLIGLNYLATIDGYCENHERVFSDPSISGKIMQSYTKGIQFYFLKQFQKGFTLSKSVISSYFILLELSLKNERECPMFFEIELAGSEELLETIDQIVRKIDTYFDRISLKCFTDMPKFEIAPSLKKCIEKHGKIFFVDLVHSQSGLFPILLSFDGINITYYDFIQDVKVFDHKKEHKIKLLNAYLNHLFGGDFKIVENKPEKCQIQDTGIFVLAFAKSNAYRKPMSTDVEMLRAQLCQELMKVEIIYDIQIE